MKKVIILILLIYSIISVPANAITRFGGPDCGQWFDEGRRQSAKSWLSGYLSGLNTAIATDTNDPLERLNSMEQAYLWIDNYCKANPLHHTQRAALYLFQELRQDQKK